MLLPHLARQLLRHLAVAVANECLQHAVAQVPVDVNLVPMAFVHVPSRGNLGVFFAQTLRQFAGLDKDVVLTGNLNRIEVWSKEKWSENCNYDDMDSIAESMQNIGIVI